MLSPMQTELQPSVSQMAAEMSAPEDTMGMAFQPYHHLVPLCYLFLPSLLQPPPSLPWNMTRTRTLRSTLSPGTNIFQKRAWLNTVLSELDSNLLLG